MSKVRHTELLLICYISYCHSCYIPDSAMPSSSETTNLNEFVWYLVIKFQTFNILNNVKFLLVLSLKRSTSQLGWNGCSQGSCMEWWCNDCIPNLNEIKKSKRLIYNYYNQY